jgi:DNA-binding transcriptional MerR regulator
MRTALVIGDFARATHLSVKTLRHYHRVGLLEPAEVDPHSGYRYYRLDQIPTAQVIKRFRELDMPLDRIAAVLATPDPAARNRLIAEHLDRLESELARTRDAVRSLRDLLAGTAAPIQVGHRSVPATPAAVVRDEVTPETALSWLRGALGELSATLLAQGLTAAGPAGGLFPDVIFTEQRGEATVFLPCDGPVQPLGRVRPDVVPAAELATTLHLGAHHDVDRAYGALAEHVTRHALAVDGPLREYYLVGPHETAEESAWRTEIGWPIFRAR